MSDTVLPSSRQALMRKLRHLRRPTRRSSRLLKSRLLNKQPLQRPREGRSRVPLKVRPGAQPLAPSLGTPVPVPPLVQLPALYAAGASRRRQRRELSNKQPIKRLRRNRKPKLKPTPSTRGR
jgi:hypothetical protein